MPAAAPEVKAPPVGTRTRRASDGSASREATLARIEGLFVRRARARFTKTIVAAWCAPGFAELGRGRGPGRDVEPAPGERTAERGARAPIEGRDPPAYSAASARASTSTGTPLIAAVPVSSST